MWNIFSRDRTAEFNYDIGEKILGLEDKSLWIMSNGKKKGSGELVSIFTFHLNSATGAQVQIAKTAVKRLKTLRHPNILTFLDAIETDKVIHFATELVVPLENYLEDDKNRQNESAISWGFHQVLKGLSFLVNDCHLIHNNVCMASVFVDTAGEWKLGGVDYMYVAEGSDCVPPVKMLPFLKKFSPPEQASGSHVIGYKWASDMWALGCLIWEVFNGTFPRNNALKSVGKIPKKLVPKYCELVSANPKSRPNPGDFLTDCKKHGGFFNNPFVESMLFLEEIQIKDQAEKNKFFSSLTPLLDSFPPQMCCKKILPLLLNDFEYGNAGSSIMAPMFKAGRHLDGAEYQKKIVPCVVKLFSSSERSTRVNLLQQMEFFVEHLSQSIVNDQLFPNICSGFFDTNPVVREATVKSMLHLAVKLNYKNLNEELMKHFARLQSKDEQGGIRTNTTVCLGKIACHLNPAMRNRILLSAFTRALRDPFAAARQAGVLAMAATQSFYHMEDIANKLLPCLCTVTRDSDKNVRDQTFRVIKCFLEKLERLSENPDLLEEMASRFHAETTPSILSPVQSAASTVDGSDAESTLDDSQAVKGPEDKGEGDGWEDDDWGDMDNTSRSLSQIEIRGSTDVLGEDALRDENDDWGSLIDTTKKNTCEETDFVPENKGLKSVCHYDWGSIDDSDFFLSMVSDTKRNKQQCLSATSKSHSAQSCDNTSTILSTSASTLTINSQTSARYCNNFDSDGWGGDDWGSPETEEFEADNMSREREWKRLQQQKQMNEKRESHNAMKFSLKKRQQ